MRALLGGFSSSSSSEYRPPREDRYVGAPACKAHASATACRLDHRGCVWTRVNERVSRRFSLVMFACMAANAEASVSNEGNFTGAG